MEQHQEQSNMEMNLKTTITNEFNPVSVPTLKRTKCKEGAKNKSRKNRCATSGNRPNMNELWNSFDEQQALLLQEESQQPQEGTTPKVEVLTSRHQPIESLLANEVAERTTCDACGAQTEMTDDGYVACTNSLCGMIYKDVLDQSPEWRFYGSEGGQTSDPSRCGIPINPYLVESSYGCKIVTNGRGSSYEMRRMRQYTEWQAMPYSEKSRYEEFQYISMMANHSGFTKHIVDDAIKYHKKLTEYDKTFRGDNKDGLTAAAFYLACRVNGYPLTAKELAAIFHLDVSSATQGCKNAQNILNFLEKDLDASERTAFCQTKPEAFVERYCTKLYLNTELTRLCHFIAIKVEKENLMSENTPHAIAAGIVYFVTQLCKMNVTKRDIHEISEISEVTINKCYRKIERMTLQLVPSAVIRKYGYEPSTQPVPAVI